MIEQTTQPQKDWTTQELATRAGVSDSRIRQLLAEGKLTGEKRGFMWFIPDSVAQQWLAQRPKEK